MPFASADRPSIQVGLMAAIAEANGFQTDVHQLNLDLAARLTPEVYELMCERRAHMTGEWLFAQAAFGSSPDEEDAYFRAFPGEFEWAEEIGKDRTFFRELRRRLLPEFIDECLYEVDWARYDVVGFSSLFQQNVASLALARHIKERHPDVTIVFGGANMEGEMGGEYCRVFDCIDYVVCGEGDRAFPALLRALALGKSPACIPGVLHRESDGRVEGRQAPPIQDLDSLPIPNYDAYFARARKLGLLPYYKATWTIPYESSRGCWWGQKHHCSFCGLNGEGMGFRSKTPERVMSELSQLADEHRICSFMAIDNILPMKYVGDVFGEIARARLDYNFFYEIKANMTRDQIRTMYHGGVRRVQPGIESLSSHVLKLMNKGTTMLQNVRCMKWLAYYGIGVNWNLIWGFPGETEPDYEEQLHALECITHLEPPVGSGRIWLERFSPHYDDPNFPVRNRRPEASYRYVYPPQVDLTKAAYFFDYEMEDTVSPAALEATHAFVERWRAAWRAGQRDSLTYRRTADGILIDQNQGEDRQVTYSVTGLNALIYEHCVETMRTPGQVADHLRTVKADYDFPQTEVRGALDEFSRARLMLDEDDRYLSLAQPLNPNW